MNYLDELLLQYPSCNAGAKGFILAQALDAAPDASASVVELLWAEAADPTAPGAALARFVLGQVLPARFAVELALVQGPPGTARAFKPQALSAALGEVEKAAHAAQGGLRVAATLVLGRLSSRRVVKRLAAELPRNENLAHAATLAETGDKRAAGSALDLVRRSGAQRPDLVFLLRALPTAGVLPIAELLVEKADAQGRAALAVALATHPAAVARPLIQLIIARREGWPTVHAMDTLAGWGEEADVALLAEAFAREQHELVRLHAVRAAGVIGGAEARAFVTGTLTAESPRVRAAALEARLRLDPNDRELAALAQAELAHPSARVRAMACRILAPLAPRLVDTPLAQLLVGSAAERLEAVGLLAYLQHPVVPRLLTRVVREDPTPALRVQAVKSLANLPAPLAWPALTELLFERPDPATVRALCRALPSLPERAAYLEPLERAVAQAANCPTRPLLLTALGTLAVAERVPLPAAVRAALAGADAAATLGALEGVRLAGDALEPGLVDGLLPHADVRVRARAAQALLLAGDEAGLRALEMLAGAEEAPAQQAALEALLEVGLALAVAGPGEKLAKLLDALVPAGHVPEEDTVSMTQAQRRDAHAMRRAAAGERAGAGAEYRPPEQDAPDALLTSYRPGALAAEAAPAPQLPDALLARPSRHVKNKGSGKARTLEPPSTVIRANRSGRRALVAAVVVAMVLTLSVVMLSLRNTGPGLGGKSVADGPPTKLADRPGWRVWTVEGSATREAAGSAATPLEPPATLAPGDRLVTPAGARLLVRDRSGNSFRLGAASQLTLAVTDPVKGPRYAFQELAGEVKLELTSEELAEVRGEGGLVVRLQHAVVSLTGARLTLESGDGKVLAGPDAGRILLAGAVLSWPR